MLTCGQFVGRIVRQTGVDAARRLTASSISGNMSCALHKYDIVNAANEQARKLIHVAGKIKFHNVPQPQSLEL